MKKVSFAALVISTMIFSACSENETTYCSIPAVVRDYNGIDGCGYVFELEDGTILEPVLNPVLFCGTPPLPKEITENPLYNFAWEDGKHVFLDYTPLPDVGSVCMAGQVVEITCLSEAQILTTE